MCSARPAAVPPAWDPARGCIEGIELLKFFSLGNTGSYAPAPCPVSHLRFPALFFSVRAGSCLRLTKSINNIYVHYP